MNEYETIRKGKANRIYYVFNCENCGKRIERRKDQFYSYLKKQNNKKLCISCSSINFNGYENEKGYIVRYYKSFDKKYWKILVKMCKTNGQIKEHRAKMAIKLNRPLEDWEIVHHINGIRNDNRIENLEIFSTLEKYNKHHCCGFRENEVLQDNIKLVAENKKLKQEIKQLKEMLKNANT